MKKERVHHLIDILSQLVWREIWILWDFRKLGFAPCLQKSLLEASNWDFVEKRKKIQKMWKAFDIKMPLNLLFSFCKSSCYISVSFELYINCSFNMSCCFFPKNRYLNDEIVKREYNEFKIVTEYFNLKM